MSDEEPVMKADGRRIGRMVGTLDDLYAVTTTYLHGETENGPHYENLLLLRNAIRDALECATVTVEDINAASRPRR